MYNSTAISAYGEFRLPVVGRVVLRVWRDKAKCLLDCKLVENEGIRPILGEKSMRRHDCNQIHGQRYHQQVHNLRISSGHSSTTVCRKKASYSDFLKYFLRMSDSLMENIM